MASGRNSLQARLRWRGLYDGKVALYSRLTIPPRSALLAVDCQRGFAGPNARHAVELIDGFLTERAQDFDLVLATRFRNPPGSNFRRLIHWNRLASEPETLLFDSVAGAADVVIDKTTYSATGQIESELAKGGIDRVYIFGIDTDVCVLQNAAGLFDRGLTPLVLVDLSATNGGPAAQEAAIPLLCRTVGSDQVLRTNA